MTHHPKKAVRKRKTYVRRLRVTGPDQYGSMYVCLQEAGGVKTTAEHEGRVLLDYDKRGNLFGIELLDVPARQSRRRK